MFIYWQIIDTFLACVNSLNTCSRLKREQGNDGNGNDGNDGNDGNGDNEALPSGQSLATIEFVAKKESRYYWGNR